MDVPTGNKLLLSYKSRAVKIITDFKNKLKDLQKKIKNLREENRQLRNDIQEQQDGINLDISVRI